MNKVVIPLIAVSILALAGLFVVFAHDAEPVAVIRRVELAGAQPVLLPLSANALAALAPSNPFGLVEPVAQFTDRITKKTFGMHITPATSPVEHDRFAGYHTGVDAEFTDTGVDIPVNAITDGVVVISKWATGYGGVVVVQHILQGIPMYALYGHLDPASMVPVGARVTAQTTLGILGDDHSDETDGVRKHLHFSMYAGEKVDIRGYVPHASDLAQWLDPMSFYQQ